MTSLDRAGRHQQFGCLPSSIPSTHRRLQNSCFCAAIQHGGSRLDVASPAGRFLLRTPPVSSAFRLQSSQFDRSADRKPDVLNRLVFANHRSDWSSEFFDHTGSWTACSSFCQLPRIRSSLLRWCVESSSPRSNCRRPLKIRFDRSLCSREPSSNHD